MGLWVAEGGGWRVQMPLLVLSCGCPSTCFSPPTRARPFLSFAGVDSAGGHAPCFVSFLKPWVREPALHAAALPPAGTVTFPNAEMGRCLLWRRPRPSQDLPDSPRTARARMAAGDPPKDPRTTCRRTPAILDISHLLRNLARQALARLCPLCRPPRRQPEACSKERALELDSFLKIGPSEARPSAHLPQGCEKGGAR